MRPFASVYPSTSIAVNKNSFSAKQWAPQQQLDVSGRSCKSGAREGLHNALKRMASD